MEHQEKKNKQASVLFDNFRRPILMIIGLIIVVIGYFLVLDPPVRAYQENLSLLRSLDKNISVARSDLQTIKASAEKMYQLTPLENKLISMALPLRSDDSAIVAQITGMAQKSGFAVSSIDLEETSGTVGGKASASNIKKTAIRLKLRGGSYGELRQLLRLMESSLMIIDINSINFSAKSLAYDLTLATYYYNDSVGVK